MKIYRLSTRYCWLAVLNRLLLGIAVLLLVLIVQLLFLLLTSRLTWQLAEFLCSIIAAFGAILFAFGALYGRMVWGSYRLTLDDDRLTQSLMTAKDVTVSRDEVTEIVERPGTSLLVRTAKRRRYIYVFEGLEEFAEFRGTADRVAAHQDPPGLLAVVGHCPAGGLPHTGRLHTLSNLLLQSLCGCPICVGRSGYDGCVSLDDAEERPCLGLDQNCDMGGAGTRRPNALENRNGLRPLQVGLILHLDVLFLSLRIQRYPQRGARCRHTTKKLTGQTLIERPGLAPAIIPDVKLAERAARPQRS